MSDQRADLGIECVVDEALQIGLGRWSEPGDFVEGEVRPLGDGQAVVGDGRSIHQLDRFRRGIAAGASNKVIAPRLGISVLAAYFQVHWVLDKAEAMGRTDAVAQAARQRLMQR